MPRLLDVTLCQRKIVEEGTNSLSLIDLIESLEFREDPPLFDAEGSDLPLIQLGIPCILFMRFVPEAPGVAEQPFQLRLVFTTPNGVEHSPHHQGQQDEAPTYSFGEGTALRIFAGIGFFPFDGYGRYEISVQTRKGKNRRWKSSGSTIVDVSKAETINDEPADDE